MKLTLLVVLFATAMFTDAQPDPKQTGPTTLVITYQCEPAQRGQLRQHMRGAGMRRFGELKAHGVLADYHVLFSRYVDFNNWDMLALLTFTNYSGLVEWQHVERATPAGLDSEGLRLIKAIHTYPADEMRHKASDAAPQRPVYLVIPYKYSVSTPEYLKYVDDYVTPQFHGWMQEGVLSRYEIYLQRYTAARPWDSIIVLQYKDDESLGARERIVAKVRARLERNQSWKAVSDNKQSIRTEQEAIIADELMEQ